MSYFSGDPIEKRKLKREKSGGKGGEIISSGLSGPLEQNQMVKHPTKPITPFSPLNRSSQRQTYNTLSSNVELDSDVIATGLLNLQSVRKPWVQ